MSKDALPPRRHGHKFAKTVAPLWNEAKLVARNATRFKKLLVLDQILTEHRGHMITNRLPKEMVLNVLSVVEQMDFTPKRNETVGFLYGMPNAPIVMHNGAMTILILTETKGNI